MSNSVIYEDVTLIELVKKFAFIYDNRDYRFKQKTERTKAWRQIGAALNMGGEECENRFHNFRSRYCKERNMIAEARDIEKREVNSDWPLFNAMKFLGPFVKNRRSRRRKYGNFESEILLQDPLLTTCELPVTAKTEFILQLSSSNSETAQSPSNHETEHQYYVDTPQPVTVSEPVRTASKLDERQISNVTSDNGATKQLMSRIKKVEDSIKQEKHEQEKPVTSHDDQFQSFGRTIAFMLTSIKNKKRQRKAMADLLTKISEYDTDSASE